jgi:hypothetical protein
MTIFLTSNFKAHKSNTLIHVNHGEKMGEKFYKKFKNSRIFAKK